MSWLERVVLSIYTDAAGTFEWQMVMNKWITIDVKSSSFFKQGKQDLRYCKYEERVDAWGCKFLNHTTIIM